MIAIALTESSLPARQRRLGPAHFAFMRALAQGISLAQGWQRYMMIEGDSSDPRLVASTLKWIRTEFGRAAAKEQRFGTARLLRLDAARSRAVHAGHDALAAPHQRQPRAGQRRCALGRGQGAARPCVTEHDQRVRHDRAAATHGSCATLRATTSVGAMKRTAPEHRMEPGQIGRKQ